MRLLILFLILSFSVHGEIQFKETKWKAGKKLFFSSFGKKCFIIKPEKSLKGNPWIWRARWPNYHTEIDVELVKKGYHIAYIDTANMFGSDKAVKLWNQFYTLLTEKLKFDKKPVIEAVSRGGLIAYRWASVNPDKVRGIYCDVPVCDFKSWPRKTSKPTWNVLLKHYGFTEKQAMAFKGNPIDVLAPIAKAKVPILHIVCKKDKVVPFQDNTEILKKRYKDLGGDIEVIYVENGKSPAHHHFTLTKEHIDKAVKFIEKQFN